MNDEQSFEPLLDVRAVASWLNVSERQVYRQVDLGKLPKPLRIGHSVRWRRSELSRWLDANCPPCRK